MRVYLDDVRPTPFGWYRAQTAAEAIRYLETGKVTEISLDHDLLPEHYGGQFDRATGYAVILWLENKIRDDENFKIPEIHIHSQSPEGRPMMLAGLSRIEALKKKRKR